MLTSPGVTLVAANPDCPDCGGTGWIRVDDGAAGSARRCPCDREQLGPRLLATAGIPPKYEACTFENFATDISGDPKNTLMRALNICRQYAQGFRLDDPEGRTPRGLLLIGPPGVGKTHLAVATLRDLILNFGVHGRFIDFTSFISRIQSTFDPSSEESKHDVIDPVLEAEVLVLDELGAQKLTPFTQDMLYLVLNTRYNQRRATLFTTNLQLSLERPAERRVDEEFTTAQAWDQSKPPASHHDLLSSRLPPSLLSRLHEMARAVVIDTEDYRRRSQSARARG